MTRKIEKVNYAFILLVKSTRIFITFYAGSAYISKNQAQGNQKVNYAIILLVKLTRILTTFFSQVPFTIPCKNQLEEIGKVGLLD